MCATCPCWEKTVTLISLFCFLSKFKWRQCHHGLWGHRFGRQTLCWHGHLQLKTFNWHVMVCQSNCAGNQIPTKREKICGLVQDQQSKTKHCYHLITGIVQMFLPAKIGRIHVTLFALKSADRLHRSNHWRKALGRHGHLQRNQHAQDSWHVFTKIRTGQGSPDRLTILNMVSNDKLSLTKLINLTCKMAIRPGQWNPTLWPEFQQFPGIW